MNEVVKWPIAVPSEQLDSRLDAVIAEIVSHYGEIEAYGRLYHAAESIKMKIESRKPAPIEDSCRESFWRRVDKTPGHGPSGDCWVWTGGKDNSGYGRFGIGNGKTIGAHRWSYIDSRGPIPNGLLMCHRCDNPPCVRPDHLFLGTHSDNMQDCSRKKRAFSLFGEENGRSKLTEDQVLDILSSYKSGESTVALGKIYSISPNHVRNLVLGNRRQSILDGQPLPKMRGVKRYIEHSGDTLTLSEWSIKLGIPLTTLSGRLNKMSLSEAISINKGSHHVKRRIKNAS